ncbi:hypothetical protein Ppa06_37110 [Planomonospora parontospora subsp. parontospora]|uniref:Methyltransferase domain-containing protein n=2 Tax=Planomonospora parontospora TaxID=58119 RepID=A0AA37BH04_9ACTN|nr:methyltransferase domain-containing protein [Planomonospora parontospora]GGK69657.1 hypothetical protein GCM10010126_31330 [Planomonospora parontospora]GII09913.1 hypothetical protein Ppa06_37110 [Planomonospora parontospora subsp. parontospora]
MDRSETAAHFDSRAAAYARDDWHVRYAERLVELAGLVPTSRVLDAATGTGFAAMAAARAVGPTGEVVAVDISAGMLAQAERLGSGVDNIGYVVADVSRLDDFADASFDAVICSAGMLYLPVERVLPVWHRLLRPGGLIGFSAMRAGFPVLARVFRACAAEFGVDLADPMAELGTEQRCMEALARAGFTGVRVVAESVTLPRTDEATLWQLHSRSPHYPELRTLGLGALTSLEARFVSEARRIVTRDAATSLTAPVLYAFGHRP